GLGRSGRRLGAQPQADDSRLPHGGHGSHHLPVRHGLICADVDRLIAASDRDGAQLLGEIRQAVARVVQIDLPGLRDVDDQLLALAGERAGSDLGQGDRYPLLQDGGRHHEDDEQHQHDVDQRRHVDVGDRVASAGCAEGHRYFFRKWRSAMLRNSAPNVSISAVNTRSCRAKRLYITTAGIAAASPTAVATSASAMPGATAWMLDDVVADNPMNAVMMPPTVPKSPMTGAVLAVVARNVRPRSSRVTSCVRARCMARCTFSRPPNSDSSPSSPLPRFSRVSRCSSWY